MPATIDRTDREEDLQYIGAVAQLWEEAHNEGLRQDADRFRAALVVAQRRPAAERLKRLRRDEP